jgi:hypothetical protein
VTIAIAPTASDIDGDHAALERRLARAALRTALVAVALAPVLGLQGVLIAAIAFPASCLDSGIIPPGAPRSAWRNCISLGLTIAAFAWCLATGPQTAFVEALQWLHWNFCDPLTLALACSIAFVSTARIFADTRERGMPGADDAFVFSFALIVVGLVVLVVTIAHNSCEIEAVLYFVFFLVELTAASFSRSRAARSRVGPCSRW